MYRYSGNAMYTYSNNEPTFGGGVLKIYSDEVAMDLPLEDDVIFTSQITLAFQQAHTLILITPIDFHQATVKPKLIPGLFWQAVMSSSHHI